MNYIISKFKKLLDIKSYLELNKYAKGFRLKLMMILVVSMIVAAIRIGMAVLTKEIVDYVLDGNTQKAVIYGGLLLIIIVIQISADGFISYKTVRVVNELKNKLELEFIRSVSKKSWSTINQYNTGDLSTRIYDDISKIVNSLTKSIPGIVSLGFQLIIGFVYLFLYDRLLALLIFTVTPLTILLSLIIGAKLKEIQYKIQETESAQRSITNESITNLIVLKVYGFIEHTITSISMVQKKKLHYIKRKNLIQVKANVVLDMGYYLGFFFAIALGGMRLFTNSISIGMMTSLMQLVDGIQFPLESISYEMPSLIASFSSIQRIAEINNIQDEPLADQSNSKTGVPYKIIFDNVTFSYVSNREVLKDINMEIQLGEKIGIIGSSGEGKTTLVNLMLALLVPNAGRVNLCYDKGELVTMTADYRHLFSYVSQKNMLFTGSIRDNLLLNEEITEADIIKALNTACCEFVDDLEEGIDTMLLEDGLGLSQGQLQRISIARSLVHKRPYLIFDEATSSLDIETEKKIINRFSQEYNNITLISITHKSEMLSICDKVFQISKGEIIAI